MKKLIITVLFSTVLFLCAESQENAIQKLFQNDLRYWYPIGVDMETIKGFLNDGRKPFTISSKSVTMKSPSGRNIIADEILTVQLSTKSEIKFPTVLYLISEGVCAGMIYLDLFENLPKWTDILKTSEEAGDNYFINKNMIHLSFKISPKEGVFSINVDVTY